MIKVHPAADLFPMMAPDESNREFESELHDTANMSRICTVLVRMRTTGPENSPSPFILSRAYWNECSKRICVRSTSLRAAR